MRADVMNGTTAGAGLLHRLSPLFFVGAAAAVVVCAWEGPLSGWYLLRAVVIGGINGSLVISLRRWRSTRLDRLLQALLVTALIAGGFFWSKDQTFGHGHAGPFWPLAGQFLAAVVAVFFAVLGASGVKTKGAPARSTR